MNYELLLGSLSLATVMHLAASNGPKVQPGDMFTIKSLVSHQDASTVKPARFSEEELVGKEVVL